MEQRNRKDLQATEMQTPQQKKRKRLLTPRRVFLVSAILLLLNLSATSIFFAKFSTASDQSDSARAASFEPVIQYGDKWQSAETFSGVSGAVSSALPFIVSNANTEVSTKAVIVVEHQGVLPLDYKLYACAEADVASATPLPPTSVSGNTITWEVEMAAVTDAPFTLSADWRQGVYSEYFNGLTDTMQMTVTCEQI